MGGGPFRMAMAHGPQHHGTAVKSVIPGHGGDRSPWEAHGPSWAWMGSLMSRPIPMAMPHGPHPIPMGHSWARPMGRGAHPHAHGCPICMGIGGCNHGDEGGHIGIARHGRTSTVHMGPMGRVAYPRTGPWVRLAARKAANAAPLRSHAVTRASSSCSGRRSVRHYSADAWDAGHTASYPITNLRRCSGRGWSPPWRPPASRAPSPRPPPRRDSRHPPR